MARSNRNYGSAPAKAPAFGPVSPKSAAAYLPSGGKGDMSGGGKSPIARRSLHSQVLGSVVGRRGAGLTSLAGGDPAAHSISHYGKAGLPGMDGGDFGDGGTGGGFGGGF